MESHPRMESGQTTNKQQRTTYHIALPSRQVSSLISNNVFNIDALSNGAIRINNLKYSQAFESMDINLWTNHEFISQYQVLPLDHVANCIHVYICMCIYNFVSLSFGMKNDSMILILTYDKAICDVCSFWFLPLPFVRFLFH